MNNKFYVFIFLFISINKTFASDIWFSPNDTDFINHRTLDGEWSLVRDNMSVFKFYSQVIRDAPDNSLKIKIKRLKEAKIKFAVEIPPLTWTEEYGKNVEGYQDNNYLVNVIKKLKRNGAELDYIALDEPIFFAFYKNKNNKTAYNNMINNMAKTLSIVWQYYPNVKVGDIEPLDQMDKKIFHDVFIKFIHDFKSKTGRHLDFLHVDIYWKGDYPSNIHSILPILKDNNIKLGIIINSNNNVKNSFQWVSQSEKNLSDFHEYAKVNPNTFIFQSWNKLPSKVLPENDDDSHASVVKFYINNYYKKG